MNRQKKINCMTFTERKREIERAGESGREGGERERDRVWKERSKGKGKAEGREGKMTHAAFGICAPVCTAYSRTI